MNEKLKFITTHQSGEYSMAELCRRFGISRKTGYKWICRYERTGISGLEEHSRAPHVHPNAVSLSQVRALLELKYRHSHWGPKKVHDWLLLNRPEHKWPAVSTISELYKRHGLVKPRRRRTRSVAHSQPFKEATASNVVWSADFKGQFRLGNGQWCYPLTMSDNHSRFLLLCRGLARPTYPPVRLWYERVFREYGLPEAIRTDNGSPFASTGLGGLTQLSVWLIRLGIMPERINPGRPDQNGRHERMHRTLKQETANPPRANMNWQQRCFNRFCLEYNEERPHEALGGVPPQRFYSQSARSYPNKIEEVEYRSLLQVRRVRSNGEIKWKGRKIYVSEALRGEPVGLDQIDDELYEVYFSQVKLGVLDERTGKIERPTR